MHTILKDLDPDELEQFIVGLGEQSYRSKQISKWIFSKYAETFSDMTDLSIELRDKLYTTCSIGSNIKLREEMKSRDGTKKYLFELSDSNRIESVLIPDGRRNTLCISTQVGCAMGCTFCLTARLGKIRNLTASEIIDQYLIINKLKNYSITNIVYMGMGEPLDNLDNTVRSLKMFTSKDCIGISPKRITVSTSGLVPEIRELGSRISINLSVSLNAPYNEMRNIIMPLNKKYPITMLLDECKRFPLPNRKRLTFEYVIIGDFNDSDKDAIRLAELLKGMVCKINLIPLNESYPIAYKAPSDNRVLSFQKVLWSYGLNVRIRKSRGRDILGACGQLAASYPLGKNDRKFMN
jgi:23S rRNA (adenine2503-C2)-methyltransferase